MNAPQIFPPTVLAAWESYATAVMPASATPIQRQEMRRAFYAGVWATLQNHLHVIGHPTISMDEGMRILQGWHDECETFVANVGKST